MYYYDSDLEVDEYLMEQVENYIFVFKLNDSEYYETIQDELLESPVVKGYFNDNPDELYFHVPEKYSDVISDVPKAHVEFLYFLELPNLVPEFIMIQLERDVFMEGSIANKLYNIENYLDIIYGDSLKDKEKDEVISRVSSNQYRYYSYQAFLQLLNEGKPINDLLLLFFRDVNYHVIDMVIGMIGCNVSLSSEKKVLYNIEDINILAGILLLIEGNQIDILKRLLYKKIFIYKFLSVDDIEIILRKCDELGMNDIKNMILESTTK